MRKSERVKIVFERVFNGVFKVNNIEEKGKNVEDFVAENGKKDEYDEFMKLISGEKKNGRKKSN